MEQESELQRLEKFVEKILTRFSALKDEKAQLEQEVFERDLLIEELRESISSKVTERNEISARVNKIVDQIEEWEHNLEHGAGLVADSSSETTRVDEEQLHSEAHDAEQRLDEEEKRVQHNLFSTADSKG
ncbi:MAG: hypothetical protein WBB19_02595 [Desulforhopalus sp.]